jgi:prepilin-type processing-associated H-X9-DG protein
VSNQDAENEAYGRNFFCPDSVVTFANSWAGHGARGYSYTQYCGMKTLDGGYVNSPSTIRDNSDWMIWSDLTTVNSPAEVSNHGSSNGTAGANCLFVDGHVEWEDVSKLSNQISRVGLNYLFLPNK